MTDNLKAVYPSPILRMRGYIDCEAFTLVVYIYAYTIEIHHVRYPLFMASMAHRSPMYPVSTVGLLLTGNYPQL